jgi:hypothetical protein
MILTGICLAVGYATLEGFARWYVGIAESDYKYFKGKSYSENHPDDQMSRAQKLNPFSLFSYESRINRARRE